MGTLDDFARDLCDALPPAIRDDPLVKEALAYGWARVREVVGAETDTASARLYVERASGLWQDLVARARGTGRVLGEGDVALGLRAKLRPRGVTRPGLLAEVGLVVAPFQRFWLVEEQAGPPDSGSSYWDVSVWWDRPTHVLTQDFDWWHHFTLFIDPTPFDFAGTFYWDREDAYWDRTPGTAWWAHKLLRDQFYWDREDAYWDRAPGTAWWDSNGTFDDGNTLRAVRQFVDLHRAAGISIDFIILEAE